MTCPNCGTETNDTFCANCGTQVVVRSSTVDATEPELARWRLRVGATMIDFLTMLVPLLVLKAIFGSVYGSAVYIVFFGVYLVGQWFVFDGQSLGNRMVQTQIRDADSGGRITLRQALWRYFYLEVYVLIDVFAIGGNSPVLVTVAVIYVVVNLLFPLGDKRNQTIHDKLARTVVVMAPRHVSS